MVAFYLVVPGILNVSDAATGTGSWCEQHRKNVITTAGSNDSTFDSGDVGALAVDAGILKVSDVATGTEKRFSTYKSNNAAGRYDSNARTLDSGDVGALAVDLRSSSS